MATSHTDSPDLRVQDTGDTRETPAINVCQGLIGDGAKLCVYDPQVGKEQVLRELSAPKFTWDHPMQANGLPMHFSSEEIEATVSVATEPYEVRLFPLPSLSLSFSGPQCLWAVLSSPQLIRWQSLTYLHVTLALAVSLGVPGFLCHGGFRVREMLIVSPPPPLEHVQGSVFFVIAPVSSNLTVT